MSDENKKQQHNPKDPGHRGGKPDGEKRSNDSIQKNYRNRTHEHERFTEEEKDSLFGKERKK